MGGIIVKATCSKPKQTARRKTRWWTYAAGVLCLALAWPAIQYNLANWRMQRALGALETGDTASAISLLEVEPESAEIAYWLAVAHRRAGHIRIFQEHLKRAQELGYPQAEIARQVLLVRIQSGEVSPELEQQAEQLIQQSDSYAGTRMDLFIDEFYEAQATGSLANYRLFDAGVALDHWVAARPDSIPARLMRADIRMREENFQAAEAECREVLARAPNNLTARLRRASLLLTNLKVEEAAEEYRICLQADPHNIRTQILMAECEYRGGQGTDAARERLEKVLKEEMSAQDRSTALSLLGEIARSRKENELAIKYLTDAVQLSLVLDAAPYRTLGSAYASLGKREEAEKYLKISQEKMERTARQKDLALKISQAPANAQLRYEQGNFFREEGRKDQAAIWWNMAVRIDPQLQEAHEALAEYYESKGDSERTDYHRHLAEQSAVVTFDKLWMELLDSNTKGVREGLPRLTKYPSLKDQTELLTLGLNVIERKDLESTAQGLGRLTNYPKLRLRSLTLLGESLYVMGHYKAAERAFHEVLSLSPRNIVAHRWLESIYSDIGAYDQMEFHALKVAELDQTDHRPHRHLGFLRREAETWEAAIRDFKESLRRSPHQQTRQEVLLEMADCYVHQLKYDEARNVLKDAAPSAQKSYLDAQCDYATKKVAEAKKTLDKSLQTSPDHVPSLLLRSEIALIDDDPGAAKKLLEQAVQAAPYDNNAHLKLSTVLLRLDEKDAAKKEAERAKELLDLQGRFSELNNQASQKPNDISIRRELAALARQLGREEEAQRWERVVEGLSEDPVPLSKGSSSPSKAPYSEKLILPPDLRPLAPKVSPKAAGPAKEPAPNHDGPKACGDEPAERENAEKRPAAREEKPAEKREETPVFSGPQKGEKLPGFTLKVAGEEEKEVDLVKEAAGKPTLLIFVHSVTRPSVGLTRVLGDYAAKRKKDGLHAGAIFLTADATETQAWIKRASGALPKDVPLGIADGGQEGPGAYGLNRNVAMTILVAKDGKVTANFALVQPSLQADGPKILKEIVDVLGGGKVPSIEELMAPGATRGERAKAPERPKPKEEEKKDGEKKSP